MREKSQPPLTRVCVVDQTPPPDQTDIEFGNVTRPETHILRSMIDQPKLPPVVGPLSAMSASCVKSEPWGGAKTSR